MKAMDPLPQGNTQMHKQNLARNFTEAIDLGINGSQLNSLDLMGGKKGHQFNWPSFPSPSLPGMSVLFNRVRSFKRDAHGALRERGDTCPVRQISYNNPDKQWSDRCCLYCPHHPSYIPQSSWSFPQSAGWSKNKGETFLQTTCHKAVTYLRLGRPKSPSHSPRQSKL